MIRKFYKNNFTTVIYLTIFLLFVLRLMAMFLIGDENLTDEWKSIIQNLSGENPAGKDLVKWLEEDGAEEAAQALKDSGIKGIKYADASTRHKTKDRRSNNYVIFDPRLIQISKKLGVAIPVAAALIANKTGQDPQELYQEDPSV